MNLLLLLVVLFALADFLMVHFVAYVPVVPGGPSVTGFKGVIQTILKFFMDVNAKLSALINSIWLEIVTNWHELAIVAAIWLVLYLYIFGVDPVLFAKILVGALLFYLSFRLVTDAWGSK